MVQTVVLEDTERAPAKELQQGLFTTHREHCTPVVVEVVAQAMEVPHQEVLLDQEAVALVLGLAHPDQMVNKILAVAQEVPEVSIHQSLEPGLLVVLV